MTRRASDNPDECKRVERSYSLEDRMRVAERLASGYSQNRTAQLCHVPQQTIADWYANAEYAQLVADLTVRFLESRENVLEQTIGLAQLVYHQAMTGDIPNTDPAVELAERLLSATAWRVRGGQQHKQFGSS